MTFYDFLQSLNDSAVGTAIREGETLFPWLEVAHVVAVTTVFGSILVVDLRLLGIASTTYPISRLTKSMLPLTWVAFIGALVTGSLMFCSQPINYFDNFAFRAKMLLLVAAGLNMIVFHLLTMRGIALWDRDAPTPLSARLAGVSSILIWVLVVAFGRWIGFTLSPF